MSNNKILDTIDADQILIIESPKELISILNEIKDSKTPEKHVESLRFQFDIDEFLYKETLCINPETDFSLFFKDDVFKFTFEDASHFVPAVKVKISLLKNKITLDDLSDSDGKVKFEIY